MKSKTFSRLTAMLIAVMLVLSMCVTGISASAAAVSDGTKVVYLKPNSNWQIANARFAIYLFEGSKNQWVDMEDDDADGYYAATLPEGNWDKIIFCRMSPSAAENNWDNKWNQTADLDIPDGMNCYTVKDGTWDKGGGEWSYYTPQGATEPTEPTEPTSPATEDEPTTAPLATDYYLFGFINGANYACEEDYENIGEYKFVNGQLTATFETASYVGVKTGDNANWYMTDGWAGIVTEVTLYNTSELGVDANKLMVPAGEVTFTLVDNGDGTLTLSYEAETLPTIPEPETTVEPTEETDPTEATEPVTDKLIVNAKSNIFPSVTETFDKDEETVTVSYKLSSNMKAVNTQWVLTYDNTKLQYDSADNMSNGEQTICPSAGNDLIFNHEDNCIKGTFSKLNLISFEEGADLVSVTFKVIGTGVADVYLDLEFFTLAYVDGDGIVQDASIVDYSEMQDISGIAGFENAEISTSTVIEGNIMMGDINDDGMISVIDVTMILKYSVGTQSLTASQMKAADVDKDGIVNVKDATMIQKYIAEMIDEL